MYATAKIHIKRSDVLSPILDEFSFNCKNLKNSVLYLYRQNYFKMDKAIAEYREKYNAPLMINGERATRYLKRFDVITQLTKEQQADFIAMPRKVSQQIVLLVAQEFRSYKELLKKFFEDLAAYKLNPKLPEPKKPRLPKYLDKVTGRAPIIFTKQAISTKYLKKGILALSPLDKSKPIHIPLGKLAEKINADTIQEVKIVKANGEFDIVIGYNFQPEKAVDENAEPNRVYAVDLGINNLMAVANNFGAPTLLFKGLALKSFNQYYNKKKAQLQSQLNTVAPFRKAAIQRRIDKLTRKRQHKVQDYLHKASASLINHAVENQVDTIIVGYNKGWKQEIELGTVNNQKFTAIPHARLLSLIQFKAAKHGIRVIVHEESYTSKCSFLDNEPLEKQTKYAGKRIKRGLFRSLFGWLINADINGAFNIMRKVIGNFDFDPIQVCSTPKTINVLKQSTVF